MEKHDDLNKDGDLPQPGTEEPNDSGGGDGGTDGPGNVSVDEPTAGALDEGAVAEENDDDDDDDDDTSTTGDESD